MRLVARLPAQDQVSALIDSLRNIGFDRKDMIVSDVAQEQNWNDPKQAAEEMTFIKSERDGLWEIGSFADGVNGLKGKDGIIVAVEIPKKEASKVRTIMEQSGAVEIVQD